MNLPAELINKIYTPSHVIKKKSHLLSKLKHSNIVFCVNFEISFIGRCKNNFHWLLVIEKNERDIKLNALYI